MKFSQDWFDVCFRSEYFLGMFSSAWSESGQVSWELFSFPALCRVMQTMSLTRQQIIEEQGVDNDLVGEICKT